MDKFKAKRLLPIFEAFANGQIIQYLTSEGVWETCYNVEFGLETERYRVKPDPQLVPFCFEDGPAIVCIDAYIKWDIENEDNRLHIVAIGRDMLVLKKFRTEEIFEVDFQTFLDDYNIACGHAAGKYVDENWQPFNGFLPSKK